MLCESKFEEVCVSDIAVEDEVAEKSDGVDKNPFSQEVQTTWEECAPPPPPRRARRCNQTQGQNLGLDVGGVKIDFNFESCNTFLWVLIALKLR